jgi:hypothetical protein
MNLIHHAYHQHPPRRTVRADFPHTALRQSFNLKATRGVDGEAVSQVPQPVPPQPRVQAFTLSKRLTTPLAPVTQKSPKPTSHKIIDVSEHFPRVSIPEVIAPPLKDGIHFRYRLLQRLFVATSGLHPDFIPQACHCFLARLDIQIFPGPPRFTFNPRSLSSFSSIHLFTRPPIHLARTTKSSA